MFTADDESLPDCLIMIPHLFTYALHLLKTKTKIDPTFSVRDLIIVNRTQSCRAIVTSRFLICRRASQLISCSGFEVVLGVVCGLVLIEFKMP